eukprot:5205941-Pyramimonas_sp.AAC.1
MLSGEGCGGVRVVSYVSHRACVTGGGYRHSGCMRWSTTSSSSRLSRNKGDCTGHTNTGRWGWRSGSG